MRKYFLSDCILSVKLLFEARDEDVVKKTSFFSFSYETPIVCPSCNENFPYTQFSPPSPSVFTITARVLGIFTIHVLLER